MTPYSPTGRARQKLRTRKQLLEAAARLMKAGAAPTLEEVAEEALVSRATAYRYFPSVEPLLVEASLDLAFPSAEEVLADAPRDPVDRLMRADKAVDLMIQGNEPALRLMLINSLKVSLAPAGQDGDARQNRRVPLIEAALEPILAELPPEVAERLVSVLALIIGTEAMLVFKDVLGMEAEAASDARRWAIATLVEAAMREARAGASGQNLHEE